MSDYQTLANIAQQVCQLDNIFKKCRNRPYVVARQICMVIMRDDFGCSLVEIARFFDMDHTTIIANVRKGHDLIQTRDYYFLNRYNDVMSQNGINLMLKDSEVGRIATNIY